MVKVRTTVYLDADIHQLASYKLLKAGSNVSEFCRHCLENLALEGVEVPNPTKIMADQVTSSIVNGLKSQQQITQKAEQLTIEQQEKAQIRLDKIEKAARKVLLRHPSFEKCLPQNDVYGDFSQVLEDLMGEIATSAGYQPTLLEVMKVWREVTA